ncbi:CHAT domain-containing tetratricopeptide repeat protein [Amycolatopsis sp. GM8]|uniref:CHAT domain-containing protein n=1 Tax=Amycolatopsis sp. GM8 TaxID=2896530 RepID=UPI001F3DE78A|nr:CHAT domain-containing tetratricopeptide repeat protein [Amycolatopsis sp. GM8]
MIQPAPHDPVLADALAAQAAVDRDPGSGLPLAERAARRAARATHPAAAATAERAWGHALLHVGELGAAARHLRRAMTWGARAGSPELTAQARHKLAFAVLQLGRPQAALREIDAALPDLHGVEAARARAQRGIVLHVIGRLDDALAEFDVALRALRRYRDLLGVQRMLINRALVHSDRHAFTAAERDLVEAETLARQLGRPLTIGLIANNLGLMETLRGDVPAALRHLGRAEEIIAAHGAQLGTLHQDRAELLLSVGLAAEAEVAAAQAIQSYRRENRSLKVPEVQLLLVQAGLLAGDPDAALRHARTALRRLRAQGRPEWTELARLSVLRAQQASGGRPRVPAAIIDTMVATLDSTGWPGAALDALIVAAELSGPRTDRGGGYLEQAAARTRGPALVRARGWYARALRRQAAGDLRGALTATRTGLRILDEYGAGLGATDLRVHAAAHRADLAALGLTMAFRTGRTDKALEWSERARASQLPVTPVRPPDDPELTALLAQLRAVTRDLADRVSAPAPLLARQAALERKIRDRSRYLGGQADGASPAPVTPGELHAALGPWALVEYVRHDGELHALTVVDGCVRSHRLATVAEAADLVERLTFALRRSAGTAVVREAAAGLLRAAAARLDGLLLRPLAEVADRPLVVVPTGPLHSLPWSVLPACRGRPITLAPSATLWHAARHRAPDVGEGPVAAVAGPRLRAAASEAEQVAAIHGGVALTGAEASVDAVRGVLTDARLVHLAAHGHLSAENPLFSAIALADGPLMIHDVERLPRVPHTLVLAACDSGRPVVHTGDELMGLAVAFLARGTAQLIASVLQIPDATTAPVMTAFHKGLAAGRSPATALAEVQQSAGDETAAAGFVCIGAGTQPLFP